MASYTATITTAAAPAQAFAYLSRFDRAAEWDPGVDAAEMLTAPPVAVGSRFHLEARFLGRRIPLEYEVVELDPDRRIVLSAENGSVRSVDTITFTDATDGSVVVYDARLEAKGIGRVADPLLGLVFRRIGDRAAAGLRAHLAGVAS
jgi:uncharacterized protein YndB with AHSA1/START domain